ncbi:hypothetical protein GMRT_11979 [Giardia muris]|uniref:Uncharacterized protein n=1 Tax=Giardia muris TaxID=5742 RepID=A0A4Z1T580_GIAMU|nr:hypothetical protein GMRT_11979 [Giardia muris]|eukprot:TNJ27611.1 hypothetical protein GMRT_11979 [Giardia muris]
MAASAAASAAHSFVELEEGEGGCRVRKDWIVQQGVCPVDLIGYGLFYQLYGRALEQAQRAQRREASFNGAQLMEHLQKVLQDIGFSIDVDLHVVPLAETPRERVRALAACLKARGRQVPVTFVPGKQVGNRLYFVEICFILALFGNCAVTIGDDEVSVDIQLDLKTFRRWGQAGAGTGVAASSIASAGTAASAVGVALAEATLLLAGERGKAGVDLLTMQAYLVRVGLHICRRAGEDCGEERKRFYGLWALKDLPYPFTHVFRALYADQRILKEPTREDPIIAVPPYHVWEPEDLDRALDVYANGIELAYVLPQLDRELLLRGGLAECGRIDDAFVERLYERVMDELSRHDAGDRDDARSQFSLSVTNVTTTNMTNTTHLKGALGTTGTAGSLVGGLASLAALRDDPQRSPAYKEVIEKKLEARELGLYRTEIQEPRRTFIFKRTPITIYTRASLKDGRRVPAFRGAEGAAYLLRDLRAASASLFSVRYADAEARVNDELRIEGPAQQRQQRRHGGQHEWLNAHITDDWYIEARQRREAVK